MLEDLLEQEKREQEKQQQHQPESGALLSDVDFERLRADVLGTNPSTSPVQGIPGMEIQCSTIIFKWHILCNLKFYVYAFYL